MFINEFRVGNIIKLQGIGISIIIKVSKPNKEDKWINNNFIKFLVLKPDGVFNYKFIELWEFELNPKVDAVLTHET